MEKDAGKRIEYWLRIPQEHKNELYAIRHWPQLKLAAEESDIWVSGFSEAEIKSVQLKAIPYKSLYRLEDNLLFPLGSKLPWRKQPALLWSPIARALPVELPDGNFNYFGTEERLELALQSSDQERPPFGMLLSIKALGEYVETAAAIRLEDLTWVILKKQLAFVIGAPLLPIQGFSYWRKGQFLLPTGYDFDLPLLAEALADKLELHKSRDWIFFNRDASFIRITAGDIQPLSRSSFRLSGTE
jgi:hypothetical protein